VIKVNGETVFTGSSPQPVELDIDVTGRLNSGSNEILMHIRDWTGAIPGHGVLDDLPAGADPRTRMFRRIPFPLASDYLCMGVLDDAYIAVVPDVSVTALWADTRMLQGQLMVRVELSNRTDQARPLRLTGLIRPESGAALASFSHPEFFLYPGVSQLSIPVTWIPAKKWSVGQPVFHEIDVEVLQGGVSVTRHSVRVGLREVRISGNRILLNNNAITLVVKEGFVPKASSTTEDAIEAIGEWMALGFNTLLMGGGVWPSVWLDAADELGMLVVASMPLPCDRYLVNRTAMEGFRLNSLEHAEGLLRRIVSHPAVFGVALTQGLLRCATEDELVYYSDLVDRLQQKVTSYGSSLLPVFLHEPNLVGRGSMDWVDGSGTTAIDWLQEGGTPLSALGGGVDPAVRAVVVTGMTAGPSEPWRYTVYRGMAALYDMVGNRSYAESVALVPMLSGLIRGKVCGWASRSDVEYGELPGVDRWLGDPQLVVGAALDSVLVAVGSMPPAFVHGEAGSMTLELTSQGTSNVTGSVSVSTPAGDLLSSRAVDLSPGKGLNLVVSVSLPAPPTGFISYPHQANVMLDGRLVQSFPVVSVAKAPVVRLEGRVGVFDPSGVLDGVFELGDADVVKLSSLVSDVREDLELVIIAPGALELLSGSKGQRVYTELEQILLSHVYNGGNLLVMEQTSVEGVLPFVLERRNARSLFGDTGSHVGSAVGRGVLASPYQGGVLADHLVRVPDWGSVYCAVRGEMGDVDRWCALLEVRRGHGKVVLFQLPIASRDGWGVVVHHLLARSIEYLRSPEVERPQIEVSDSAGAWWPGALDLTVARNPLSGACATAAVVGQGDQSRGEALAGLEQGGLQWVHVTEPHALSSLLGAEALWAPVRVLPVFPLQTKDHGDFADLYSRFEETGILALTSVSGWYAGGASVAAALQPGQWTVHHQPLEDPQCIPAGGQAQWAVDIPPGTPIELRLTLEAHPVVSEVIVGRVMSGQRSARFRLAAGVHEVRVGFPDSPEGVTLLGVEVDHEAPDYLAGTAARVCVREVSLVRAGFSSSTVAATLPALLVDVSKAGEGRRVLDGWSRQVSGRNPRHVGVISRWLGRQGVVVDSPLSVRIPASRMDVVGSKLVRNEGERVWLRDNGSLESLVEFPRTGPYRFLVSLMGTPVLGSYPVARIMVDDVEVGTIGATRLQETFFVDGQVESGIRTVSLRFEDDALLPPEDRDVAFSLLEVAALRANHAPWVAIETEYLATQVRLSAACLWDPDGDEVSVRLAVRRDACPDKADEWVDGDSSLFTVEPFQWHYAGVEARDARRAVTRRCRHFRFVPDAGGTGDDPGAGDTVSGDALIVGDVVDTDVSQEPTGRTGEGRGGCQPVDGTGTTGGGLALVLACAGLVVFRRRSGRFILP
jgi:hypothetical protein